MGIEIIDKELVDAFSAFSEACREDDAISACKKFAERFGGASGFDELFSSDESCRSAAEARLASSFYKNLTLLIRKTWIEKSDESAKQHILMRLDDYRDMFGEKQYLSCYKELLPMIRDVMFLMFGQESQHDDFLEYAMRIDPDIGLFWWFVSCLISADEKCLQEWRARTAILTAMLFLANF